MRPPLGLLLVAALSPALAHAAGLSRVYLVPALKQCPGPTVCPREFESTYTFDAIVLRTPTSKYAVTSKPSLILDVHGLKDATGKLVTGVLSVKVVAGRVSLPGFGTLPDDSLLTQVPPQPFPVTAGKAHFPYHATPTPPDGLLTNGGGVQVLDPDGKPLAVTGTQTKP